MKLIKVGNEFKVEVKQAPYLSRVFKTRYAAIVYARRMKEKLKLDALMTMGIGV